MDNQIMQNFAYIRVRGNGPSLNFQTVISIFLVSRIVDDDIGICGKLALIVGRTIA